MWLKTEPTQLHLVSSESVRLGEMFKLARSIFSFFERDIHSLNIGVFDSREILGKGAIESFVDENRLLHPALTSGDSFSFDSQSIEGLERKVGADSELSLVFHFKNDVADPHMQVRLRSHLIDTEAQHCAVQLVEAGRLITRTFAKVSGFAILDAPWRFLSSYSAKTMNSEDSFGHSVEEVYRRVAKELLWYGRLARPTELMVEHGMFRNVYPYNFLCEEQIFSLKMLFKYEQFPTLSASLEDRLKKRSKFTGGSKKPILPGTLTDIGRGCALWCVPYEKKQGAFDVLAQANLTLYRNFIDCSDLFDSK